MKARYLLGLTTFGILLTSPPRQAAAQAEVGAQLDLFSSYVWRGVTLTNKPVAQPDLWVSFPAGSASITVGGWSNIDLGQYDDADDDISESGGLSAFNFAEFNPYAEVGFTTGKTSIAGGIVGYIYPNDLDDAPNGGLDSETNTWELYTTVGFDVPLAPEFSLYYDIDKVSGAYFEGGVSHSLPLGESHSLDLAGLLGVSLGQGFSEDDESFNFDDDGVTHADFSAGVPLTAGAFSITPVLHFQVSVDDATKFHSPTSDGSDVKLWGGVSIGWSNAAEETEAEAEE
ncbi:MAG TPA: TorF family putative porin [Gemmatimonadales bacterium]|nr:TorF family putative porin [Gemmatimonadales bacterium]